MIAPLGTFLTRMDAALVGSIDGLIGAMTTRMAAPIALAAVVFYAIQGLRLANGDPSPLHNFVPQIIRVGVVIWLSTNLAAFNFWVRDIFFIGLPNALASAVGSATGAATGLTGTAAVFDAIWAQIWVVVGTSWSLAGVSVTGVVAGISGFLTGVVCGVGLIAMAIVYVGARMVLAVIICAAPVIIGCALFDVTRPIFERAVGKVVSLILLQTLGLIILEILLLGDQWFMAQATTQILATMGGGGVFWTAMEALAALAIWFLAGAFAMYTLPQIAYSIGSGIVLNSNMIGWAMLARAGGGGVTPSIAAPSPSPSPNYSLSLAQPSLSGPSPHQAAPPPPPPPISTSTRR